MKLFVVYSHTRCNGELYHQAFTQCYAFTIEEAVENFCDYMHRKFPTLNRFQFCLQEVAREPGTMICDPFGPILGVVVNDLQEKAIATTWNGHDDED